MQVEGVRDSLQEGCFYQINVLPRLAFDALDTVYQSKCSDKRFG